MLQALKRNPAVRRVGAPVVNFIRAAVSKKAAEADGYGCNDIVDLVYRKTVGFDPDRLAKEATTSPDAAKTLFAVAFASTVSGPELRVLDHGGACGFHFLLARSVLGHVKLRWAVVETPEMVGRARSLATGRLGFFATIEEAVTWLGGVDLVHSSGTLQCCPEPLQELSNLVRLNAPTMAWLRMDMQDGDRLSWRTVPTSLEAHGPGQLSSPAKKLTVNIRMARIPLQAFFTAHAGYRLTWEYAGEMPGYLFARPAADPI